MLHIRLPDKTHQEIKASAALQGKSITRLIGEIIDEYLRKTKENL